MVVFGFSISPLWAMLMLHTQRQLGPDHAPHAIGFQMAAASIGFGLVPGAAGVMAQHHGLESVPKLVVGLTAMMLVFWEISVRMGRREPATLVPG
jgi:predicted MFS family arabinose efflux permease